VNRHMRKHLVAATLLCALTVACDQPSGPTVNAHGYYHYDANALLPGFGKIDTFNRDWKFRTGDDPSFAQTSYDDSAWPVQRNSDIVPDSIRVVLQDEERAGRRGIAWFRLHVTVDSADAGDVYLIPQLRGPSELYLNGVLIHSVGDPTESAKNADGALDFSPLPVHFPAGKSILAVRANLAALSDVQTAGPPFLLDVLPRDGLNDFEGWQRAFSLWFGFPVGVLLGLGVLHFLLFAMLRQERAHAHFAGFAFGLAIPLLFLFFASDLGTTRVYNRVSEVAFNMLGWDYYFLLAFLYTTFRRTIPRYFWILLSITVITTLVVLLGLHHWASATVAVAFRSVLGIVPFLCIGEAVRVIVFAVKDRVDGGRIIATGLLVTLCIFGFMIVPLLTGGVVTAIPLWLMNVAFLALPTASSVHLVRNIARTSRGFERLSRNLEDEVALRTEQLREARIIADEANRAKSQFLANMSHELRTPLNAIIGYSEMLIDETRDNGHEDYAPDLQRVHGSGRHLLGLINDVLDLSKVEAGRMDLVVEEFDVERVIAEVTATVQPLLMKNHNRLETRVEPDVSSIRSDEVKLRQILYNLLSNASKFTSSGLIVMDAAREDDVLVIRVQDSGIGMTPEQMTKLFQPFSQADTTTSRDYGGTGLGLTISKRFAQLMGGDIDVQSEAGAGTMFTVRIVSMADEGVAAGGA
jgi:signal transduction histidine kinase